MKKFTHFLFYNNTIPLLFGILFLGAGATFAASPEARSTVVSVRSAAVSIDNSYLLNSQITDETVQITIGSVTEDDRSYYIEYQLRTLSVQNAMWQPVVRTNTLTVNKESIVGVDLGLYAEAELAEVHAAEVRFLLEAQASERLAGLTPKVVTTEYDGLVGQFFDPDQEVFPGYDPLISPSVGIPLTSEQEAAHREVKRLLEASKEAETPTVNEEQETQSPEPENQSATGGGDQTYTEPPTQEETPIEVPPPAPTQEETPPTENPTPPPEPAPEPAEPPLTLDLIL